MGILVTQLVTPASLDGSRPYSLRLLLFLRWLLFDDRRILLVAFLVSLCGLLLFHRHGRFLFRGLFRVLTFTHGDSSWEMVIQCAAACHLESCQALRQSIMH